MLTTPTDRQLTLSKDSEGTQHPIRIQGYPPQPESPTWDYRFRYTDDGEIDRTLSLSANDTIQVRFGVGDPLYRVTTKRRENEYRLVEARRFHIKDIQLQERSLYVTLVYCADPIRYSRDDVKRGNIDGTDGDWTTTIPAAKLIENIYSSHGSWRKTPPKWYEHRKSASAGNPTHPPGLATSIPGTLTLRWEPIAPESPHTILESPSELSFEQITGSNAEQTISEFLSGGPDGQVDHALGAPGPSKAFFIARGPSDAIHAAAVLAPHPNPAHQGRNAYLSRLAAHPARPPNTASWMLARIKNWARKAGYEELVAIAGISDNRGTAYRAAGFSIDQSETGWVNGDARTRPNRQTYRDGAEWYRRRWIAPLTTRPLTLG